MKNKLKSKKKRTIQIHNNKNTHKNTHKNTYQNKKANTTAQTNTTTKTNTNTKSKIYINNLVKKIEFDILITTITNQIIFLINIKTPKDKIKEQILSLLKIIRDNNKLIKNKILDDDLNIIYNHIYKFTKLLHKHLTIAKKNNKHDIKISSHKLSPKLSPKLSKNTYKSMGGFYFKNLEEKGDEPITGNDLVKFLDEVDRFIYNAQWTDEGAFLRDPYTLFNMLRGNTDAFKQYVTWHVLPKYYQLYPPFIRWDGIKDILTRKWEDLPDYLLAYQSYQLAQDEYLVEKGLKSPDVLNKGLYKGFFDKLSHSLDTNIQKMQQYRRKYQGAMSGSYTFQLPL